MVEYIESKVEDKFIEATNVFATKEDLFKLELRIIETINHHNLETQKLISESRSETIKQVSELRSESQKQTSETLKWMFGFILGSTIAIIGTILTVMKMGG